MRKSSSCSCCSSLVLFAQSDISLERDDWRRAATPLARPHRAHTVRRLSLVSERSGRIEQAFRRGLTWPATATTGEPGIPVRHQPMTLE